MLRLTLLDDVLAVARFDRDAPVPGWVPERGLTSVTRTAHELSVVCAESRVPHGVHAERGWRCFELGGPFPFDAVGVLASVVSPLAAAGIPIFALSTFDTDYVLVKEADAAGAVRALEAAGHTIARPHASIGHAPNGDLALVRTLFEEYWQSFGFTPCFQDFGTELAKLPGDFVPPGGALAMARWDGEAAGCVALRRFDDHRCEAKRLFVRPQFRGRGLGQALLEWVIREARRAGYREMVGDTMPVMREALAMYERRGFEVTGPYGAKPTPGAIFLRLKL